MSASTELHASLRSCRGCHGFVPLLGNVCHSVQKLQQALCLRARWRSFLKVPVATLCVFEAVWYYKSMNSRFEKLLYTVNVQTSLEMSHHAMAAPVILEGLSCFTSTHQWKAAESRRGNIYSACNAKCLALVWHHFPRKRNMCDIMDLVGSGSEFHMYMR